jgi:sarcosine oxidase
MVRNLAGMNRTFDVIVVGVGGMGSAACYHLAKRGKRVLGLERFDIPHAMGSSHGINRIIRLAYYEDPSYVPLLRRSYELWRELQTEFGEQLLHITGSVDASHRDGDVFGGALHSCQLHDLPHEVLTSPELSARFPGFTLPPDHFGLFQPEGGFLMSERAIVAHVDGAISAGAEIHARERVIDWDITRDGVKVTTDRGTYEAERLVISAGAWMQSLVPELQMLSQPERQVLAWFQPIEPGIFSPQRFPVFNLAVDEGRYYGFPVHHVPGFKVGRYHHLDEQVSADTVDREPNANDEEALRSFTERYFPRAAGPTMALRSCLFTNTPDEHFIIDHLPGMPQVTVASPCSGHGYKFCSVVGEILADLSSGGSTTHDIALFRLDRFNSAERAEGTDQSRN